MALIIKQPVSPNIIIEAEKHDQGDNISLIIHAESIMTDESDDFPWAKNISSWQCRTGRKE